MLSMWNVGIVGNTLHLQGMSEQLVLLYCRGPQFEKRCLWCRLFAPGPFRQKSIGALLLSVDAVTVAMEVTKIMKSHWVSSCCSTVLAVWLRIWEENKRAEVCHTQQVWSWRVTALCLWNCYSTELPASQISQHKVLQWAR